MKGQTAGASPAEGTRGDLQISFDRFQRMLGAEAVGIVVAGADGRINECNDCYLRTIGYSRQEFERGEVDWRRLTPAEWLPFDEQAIAEVRIRGVSSAYEKEYQLRDGTRVAILVSLVLLPGAAEEIAAYVIDITEQRRAKTALRQSELLQRAILDSTADFIWSVDPKSFRILTYNQALADYFASHGVTIKVGSTVEEMLSTAEAVAEWKGIYERSLREGAICLEYGTRHSNRILNVRLKPLVEGGTVFGISIFGRDVTSQRQAESALRESEAKFSTIFQLAPCPIAITRPKDARIIDVNQAFVDWSGFSRAELIGQSTVDLGIWVDRSQRLELIKNANLEQGRPASFVTKFRVRGGAVRDVWYFGQTTRLGEDLCLLGCLVDVTDKVAAEEAAARLQERLNHAQRLEAIGTLAGGIAHDFNNILGAIRGYTELALQKSHDSEQADDLRMVDQAAGRAADLVRQILAFSRMTNEEPRPIQPKLIVAEALKLVRGSLPSTIEIRQQLTSKAVVLAEPGEIHRIIVNLCANAALAMKSQGGVLDVQLEEVQLDRDALAGQPDVRPGPFLRLTVRDTGCGMSEQVMSRIFEPYFTTRENGEGTGLGLAVVHGLVKKRGGAISVSSQVGKGTTFEICWPMEDRAASPAPVREDGVRGCERILFVDDEPMLVDVARQGLSRLGYQVTCFDSSPDALHAFRANPEAFDVVIADVTMPRMTGDVLAEEILRVRPKLPIILCSGFSERVDEAKNTSWSFARKPIRAAELSRLIRKVVAA